MILHDTQVDCNSIACDVIYQVFYYSNNNEDNWCKFILLACIFSLESVGCYFDKIIYE